MSAMLPGISAFTGRKTWKERVKHLTPAWHTVNMGTGAVTLLFHSFPYGQSSPVLQYIALIIEIFNLILFLLFLVGTITRYILFRPIWSLMLRHPVQSLYLGAMPMGFATMITAAVGVIYESLGWGGVGFLYTLWGLWWATIVVSIVVFFGELHIMFTRHTHDIPSMTTVWLLPVVTPVVVSSTGGVLALALLPVNQSYSLMTFSLSLALALISLAWAFMILTIYVYRLMIYRLPEGIAIFSAFLPLGPMGQAGYSLLIAGESARIILPTTSTPDLPLSNPLAPVIVEVLCLCISFTLWALATAWFALAFMAIVESTIKIYKLPFKITFWGMIFPNGVYANLTIQLGTVLNSDFFRVWGAIYSVATILLWLFAIIRTFPGVWDGSAFQSPCVEEAEAEGWLLQKNRHEHEHKHKIKASLEEKHAELSPV